MKYLCMVVLIVLAGCGQKPEVIVQAPPEIHRTMLKDIIPDDELKCQTEPDGAAVSTVRQSADYIVKVKKAGQNCRKKLSNVREIIRSEQ